MRELFFIAKREAAELDPVDFFCDATLDFEQTEIVQGRNIPAERRPLLARSSRAVVARTR